MNKTEKQHLDIIARVRFKLSKAKLKNNYIDYNEYSDEYNTIEIDKYVGKEVYIMQDCSLTDTWIILEENNHIFSRESFEYIESTI